jgi:hypothetical protein
MTDRIAALFPLMFLRRHHTDFLIATTKARKRSLNRLSSLVLGTHAIDVTETIPENYPTSREVSRATGNQNVRGASGTRDRHFERKSDPTSQYARSETLIRD